MAGKRIFKVATFTHSGEGDTLSQVIEMPEGGASGLNSIFMRRVSGTGDGHIEKISGCFDAAGEYGYELGNSYNSWDDSLGLVRLNDNNLFPYLIVEMDFEDDFEEVVPPAEPEDPPAEPDSVPATTVVEVYITAY